MTAKQAIEELKNRVYLYRKNWLGDHYEMERYLETYEVAIEALEKQIPKKPLNIEDHYIAECLDYDYSVAECPCCKIGFSFDEYYRPSCCNDCGQRFDWGEEE